MISLTWDDSYLIGASPSDGVFFYHYNGTLAFVLDDVGSKSNQLDSPWEVYSNSTHVFVIDYSNIRMQVFAIYDEEFTLRAIGGPSTISLFWDMPYLYTFGDLEFHVEKGTSSSNLQTIFVIHDRYFVDGVIEYNNTYFYRVEVYKGSDYFATSFVSNITITTYGDTPTTVTVFDSVTVTGDEVTTTVFQPGESTVASVTTTVTEISSSTNGASVALIPLLVSVATIISFIRYRRYHTP